MFRYNKNKGFTLIELLVVVAIIGILSSIVLGSLNSARDKSKDAAIKSTLANIRSQAELYFYENNLSYGTATSFSTNGTCVDFAADSNPDMFDLVNNSGESLAIATRIRDMFSSAMSLSGTSGANTGVCNYAHGATPRGWAVAVPLKSNPARSWCVDYAGNSTEVDTTPTTIPQSDPICG